MRNPISRLALLLLLAFSFAGCGGGGSSSSGDGTTNPGGGTNNPGGGTNNPPTTPSYNTAYQASGSEKISAERFVTITESGVEVFGKSTTDESTSASGLSLMSIDSVAGRANAEARVNKDSEGNVTNLALLLSDIGITWDGITERPLIIETFDPTQGRSELDADDNIKNVALPGSSDLAFYDVATKGTAATQGNYANNRYFPRSEPARCDTAPCPNVETVGLETESEGDWRTGGSLPDHKSATRLHEDGDIHAGNAVNGGPLPGGTGVGVPYASSKGYRKADIWSYRYSNLAAWFSQDTVDIAEWLTILGKNEHNQNRRGAVAFGAVTDAASLPSSGTASYEGIIYGWYASGSSDAQAFTGTASVVTDFSTRRATVTIRSATSGTGVFEPFTVTISMASGTNYFHSGINTGPWTDGGIGARYFGPVSSGSPEEFAGAFSLSGSGGAVVVAGFITRKS